MARKALTIQDLEARLKPFDDLYAEGLRWGVIYQRLGVSKQYVYKLRKQLETLKNKRDMEDQCFFSTTSETQINPFV